MAILIINPHDAICGDCGKSADYKEAAHITQLGYVSGKGCGAIFNSVGSDYIGKDGDVGYLRPDLEFVPPELVHTKCKIGV